MLVDAERLAVDARKHPDSGHAPRNRTLRLGRRGTARIAVDHRNAVRVLIVVPLLNQRRHIEQAPIQLIGGDVGQHFVRENVEVLADRLGPYPTNRAVRPSNIDGLVPAADVMNDNDIAGDEGDRKHRR